MKFMRHSRMQLIKPQKNEDILEETGADTV
jgi:hypothetical protein